MHTQVYILFPTRSGENIIVAQGTPLLHPVVVAVRAVTVLALLLMPLMVGSATATAVLKNTSQWRPAAAPTLLLFTDNSLFASIDRRLELRNNAPAKGPRIISPTEPWESWAVCATWRARRWWR